MSDTGNKYKLNRDCWIEILNYLDWSDIQSINLVNKYLSSLIQETQYARLFRIREIVYFNINAFLHLSNIGHYIKHLSIVNAQKYHDVPCDGYLISRSIGKYCPNLQWLILRDVSRFINPTNGDGDPPNNTIFFPKLQILELHNINNLPERTKDNTKIIESYLNHCDPQCLKKFHLEHLYQLSDKLLFHQSLQYLSHININGGISFSSVCKYLKLQNPNIKSLYFTGEMDCSPLEIYVAKNLKNLKLMFTHSYRRSTLTTSPSYPNNIPVNETLLKLNKLSLHTFKCLEIIQLLPQPSNLEYLSLTLNDTQTTDLLNLNTHCKKLVSLKTIQIDCIFDESNYILDLLLNTKSDASLTKLNLNVESINGVEKILKKFYNLNELNLYATSLTDQNARNILCTLANLKKLIINFRTEEYHNFNGFTDDFLHQLTKLETFTFLSPNKIYKNITSLINLKSLELSCESNVLNEWLSIISELKSLEKLAFDPRVDCMLNHEKEIIQTVNQMPKLKRLILYVDEEKEAKENCLNKLRLKAKNDIIIRFSENNYL